MIVELARAVLLDDAAVTALVGERVYPVTMPDAPTFPLVVLTKVAGAGEYTMQGDAGLERARLQVDVHHDGGYEAMTALKRAVRARLSGFRGSVDSGPPCQIQASMCINDEDLAAPSLERAGPRVRRRMLEFIIWTTEV